MCTAISYGYASTSFSYIAEYLVTLEIKPTTKNLADTVSLHLWVLCAPLLREALLGVRLGLILPVRLSVEGRRCPAGLFPCCLVCPPFPV